MAINLTDGDNFFLLGTPGNDHVNGGLGSDIFLLSGGNDFYAGENAGTLLPGEGDPGDIDSLVARNFGIQLAGPGTLLKINPNTGNVFGTDTYVGIERFRADADFTNTIGVADRTGDDPANFNVVDLTAQTLKVNLPTLFGGTVLNFLVENFDNVIGTLGDDDIKGDAQSNELSGLAGDDTIRGTDGDDIIDGGEDFDTLAYNGLNQAVTLTSNGVILKEGGGTDLITNIERIVGDNGNAGVVGTVNTIDGTVADPATQITSFVVDLSGNDLTVQGVPTLGEVAFKVLNFDRVIGTNNDDVFTGDADDNEFSGAGGSDTFNLSLGNDVYFGEVDAFTLPGADGDTDSLVATGFALQLTGPGALNKLDGSGTVLGTDTYAGIERFVADASFTNTIGVAGRAGDNPANFNVVDLSAQTLQVNLPTLFGGTVLNFIVENFDNVIGTAGDDAIKGDAQANELLGEVGSDLFFVTEGNDTVSGETATSVFDADGVLPGGGASGDIDTYSALGTDIRLTIAAAGVVEKSLGASEVSAGTDQIFGIEVIQGAEGLANLIDGSGDSGPTSFTIDLQTGGGQGALTITGLPGVAGEVSFTVENFVDVIGTRNDDSVSGDSQDNLFDGGRGDDFLRGRRGDDELFGKAGDDKLSGGRDDDLLVGGGGDDVLRGQDGDDVLNGGDGSDRLIGGSGMDTFVFDDRDFNNNGGEVPLDRVTDFEFGIDTVRFRFDGGFFQGSGIETRNNGNQAEFSTVTEFDMFLDAVLANGGSVTINKNGNNDVLVDLVNPANGRELSYLFLETADDLAALSYI